MATLEQAFLYYAEHPVEFVEDIIGAKPDKQQSAILESVQNNTMTTVRAGHGVGKTAVEAWVIIWFMFTRPYPKIPCTAPTQHQLYDILWAEISKWIRNSPILSNDLIWQNEKLYMKGYRSEWFAVPRTASKPDALQGFHAEYILYIIDEASGVDDKIFEPVLGSLSTEGARLLMCGNPTQLSGFFYDSFHKNRASYSALHIDGRYSPHVSEDFVNTIANMYGEDSDVFRVRVAGEFPLAADDVFIPLPLIEKSIMTECAQSIPISISIGCDIARYGDDETVICTNAGGAISLPVIRKGQSLMKTVGEIVAEYRVLLQKYPKYKGKVFVNIDDTGLGGGVTDRINEVKFEERLNRMVVVPINFSCKVSDDKAADHYADLTTYMWSIVKKQLQNGELFLINDNVLVAQLSVRKYGITSSGKIVLESKKEMKKRGVGSPDRADALALSCYREKIFDLGSLI